MVDFRRPGHIFTTNNIKSDHEILPSQKVKIGQSVKNFLSKITHCMIFPLNIYIESVYIIIMYVFSSDCGLSVYIIIMYAFSSDCGLSVILSC